MSKGSATLSGMAVVLAATQHPEKPRTFSVTLGFRTVDQDVMIKVDGYFSEQPPSGRWTHVFFLLFGSLGEASARGDFLEYQFLGDITDITDNCSKCSYIFSTVMGTVSDVTQNRFIIKGMQYSTSARAMEEFVIQVELPTRLGNIKPAGQVIVNGHLEGCILQAQSITLLPVNASSKSNGSSPTKVNDNMDEVLSKWKGLVALRTPVSPLPVSPTKSKKKKIVSSSIVKAVSEENEEEDDAEHEDDVSDQVETVPSPATIKAKTTPAKRKKPATD